MHMILILKCFCGAAAAAIFDRYINIILKGFDRVDRMRKLRCSDELSCLFPAAADVLSLEKTESVLLVWVGLRDSRRFWRSERPRVWKGDLR